MKNSLKLVAACAALALAASPGSAQLLGGGGGLGGTLGGAVGGTLGGTLGGNSNGGGIGRGLDGTLNGSGSARAGKRVDTRSGSANADAGVDGALSGALGSGRASGSAGASGSKNANAGVQGVGADSLAGTLNDVARTAGDRTARGQGQAQGHGQAQGSGGFGFGSLAAAGSAAANTAGAAQVAPGMIVRDSAGRAMGEVQNVRARANGMVDTVFVDVGDRTAALPADNFSLSGDALVSAMSRAEVKREARRQDRAN